MKNILILIIAFLLLVACSSEVAIKARIQTANYCETKEDCVKIASKCPFGCNVYVNKNEAQHIQSLIDNADTDCVYKCALLQDVECVEQRCEPK